MRRLLSTSSMFPIKSIQNKVLIDLSKSAYPNFQVKWPDSFWLITYEASKKVPNRHRRTCVSAIFWSSHVRVSVRSLKFRLWIIAMSVLVKNIIKVWPKLSSKSSCQNGFIIYSQTFNFLYTPVVHLFTTLPPSFFICKVNFRGILGFLSKNVFAKIKK